MNMLLIQTSIPNQMAQSQKELQLWKDIWQTSLVPIGEIKVLETQHSLRINRSDGSVQNQVKLDEPVQTEMDQSELEQISINQNELVETNIKQNEFGLIERILLVCKSQSNYYKKALVYSS